MNEKTVKFDNFNKLTSTDVIVITSVGADVDFVLEDIKINVFSGNINVGAYSSTVLITHSKQNKNIAFNLPNTGSIITKIVISTESNFDVSVVTATKSVHR